MRLALWPVLIACSSLFYASVSLSTLATIRFENRPACNLITAALALE